MSLATTVNETMMENGKAKEPATRSLRWLLAGIVDAPAVAIGGLSSDSQTVTEQDVFLACRGASHHGLSFLEEAISAGAAAVVWDSEGITAPAARPGLPMVPVAGLTHRLGEIANRWFDTPSAVVRLSGVTGTNGKTTVAFLIAQCLQILKKPCGYLGTLGAGIDSLERTALLTTPGCIDLHRHIAHFRSCGAGHAALEVSSHAIAQNRIDGLQFDSVIFTNLSRDHIDYHGDMRSYGETKSRFILQQDARHRIINIDSDFGRRLCDHSGDAAVAVSTVKGSSCKTDAGRFLRMQALTHDDRGGTVQVSGSWGEERFHLPLVGEFNVSNAALVLAQLLCWDIPLGSAAAALSRVSAPAGRMQRVVTPSPEAGPFVYVDYAHTPAGLEAALASLRDHGRGRLWCVFGCGGDRDKGKREAMGETVARLADQPIVTTDNPRSEPPEVIIAAVLRGMTANNNAVTIEDRAAAIGYAITHATGEDIVLIAGKGHEDYQLIGTSRHPFSDYQVALSHLVARQSSRGDA